MRPEVVHNSASDMVTTTFDQGWSDANHGQAKQGHADVASTPSRRRDERSESRNHNNMESDNNTGQVATVRGRQAGGARDDKDSGGLADEHRQEHPDAEQTGQEHTVRERFRPSQTRITATSKSSGSINAATTDSSACKHAAHSRVHHRRSEPTG